MTRLLAAVAALMFVCVCTAGVSNAAAASKARAPRVALEGGAFQQTQAQGVPPLPRVFIEDAIAIRNAIAAAEALGPNHPVRIGARIAIVLPDAERAAALGQHLQLLSARRIAVWIAVAAPETVDAVPAWQAAMRELINSHSGTIAILEIIFAAQPEDLRRFALQVAATEARATRDGATLVAIGGQDSDAIDRVVRGLSPETAPYVDLLAVAGQMSEAGMVAAFHQAVPAGRLVRRAGGMGEPRAARERIVRDVFETVGTSWIATAWGGTSDALADGIRALAPAADLLAHRVEQIDPSAAGLTLTQAGGDIAAAVTHRLLFDEDTFSTYLVYEGPVSRQPVTAALRLPVDSVPVVIDPIKRERTRATGYVRDEETRRSRVELPLTGRPMLVNFSEGAAQVVERSDVAAERQLSVEEIVARHRQYQARLDVAVRNYRAAARMEQHFRPSLTDPGYDVVTENEYFVDDTTVEWEERSFSVNGSKWGSDRPPFPLLQPEKVLSLPLELRLDVSYRYELAGTERIGEYDCYRVRFDPLRTGEALYRGTVWIDRRTFARVRVQAVQTRTSAPVVSNEETHTYEPVADIDGFPVLLLTRLTARQIVLIAGRNLLLEKAATFTDFRLNTADFHEARETTRRSDGVMYRETERGLRYLVKEGGTRVVSERATASARAMAMGLLVDPSFAFPLPIFGINYLDFEFRGRTDTQFALLFGGVLAAGNLQRPKLAGTPFDASIDFFGIAAPASDRLYVEGGEKAGERLLSWPLSTGLNLGWQYTAFQKAQLQYQLRFDPFVRDRTTDASFVVPSSTVTQGVGGAWEYKRRGYSVGLNGTWFARSDWKPWGPAEALNVAPARTYAKYAAHVSRDFYFNVFQKVHLNVSYFGGQRLDRFSRYQFGLFDDTRIHGVPASGVRFDDLGMIRGSYSLNIFEQYRVDLFADQAWGRDRAIDASWRPVTGLGVAVNLRAPWNTILRADVGKSLLPDPYGPVGSMVFQVMILKPLK